MDTGVRVNPMLAKVFGGAQGAEGSATVAPLASAETQEEMDKVCSRRDDEAEAADMSAAAATAPAVPSSLAAAEPAKLDAARLFGRTFSSIRKGLSHLIASNSHASPRADDIAQGLQLAAHRVQQLQFFQPTEITNCLLPLNNILPIQQWL